MGKPSKALPIDATGRVLITEAAEKEVATAKIMVGTTAVTLTTNTSGLERRKLFVRNGKDGMPEVIVYIGDGNVTTSTGFPLYKLDELELDVDSSAVVKAIRASGPNDAELRIMEIE